MSGLGAAHRCCGGWSDSSFVTGAEPMSCTMLALEGKLQGVSCLGDTSSGDRRVNHQKIQSTWSFDQAGHEAGKKIHLPQHGLLDYQTPFLQTSHNPPLNLIKIDLMAQMDFRLGCRQGCHHQVNQRT